MPDRKHRDASSPTYLRKSWIELVKREVSAMVYNLAPSKDREEMTLLEYQRHLYRHVPGGSGVSVPKVAGYGKTSARFTKTATLELADLVVPSNPCNKLVSKPFLKREVAKSRWLYPLDTHATVRSSFLESHLKQIMHGSKRCSLGKKKHRLHVGEDCI